LLGRELQRNGSFAVTDPRGVNEVAGTQHAPARALRVIAADENEVALRRTAALLEELGHEVTACTESVDEACAVIARDEPDVAVVVVHDDLAHALDLIDELSEALAGPVIALQGAADATFAEAAAQRGLDALASEPTADALQAAIEVAMRRHAERAQLSRTVGQLEHALERRALIERAKGIVMERHGLDERAAFELLRGQARGRNMTVVAMAAEVCEPG
jgi:AmiR/NasT family two-component response regulator